MSTSRSRSITTFRLPLALLPLLLATPAWALEPGDPAPQFSAPALGGGPTVALAQHRGKVVFVDFWASWCPPCLQSLPMLDALRKEFPADRFQILAVNLDHDPAKGVKFLKKRPVGYPSAQDPEGRLPKSFELQSMPSSYLIDQQGVIRYVHEGFVPADIAILRDHIAKLVNGR